MLRIAYYCNGTYNKEMAMFFNTSDSFQGTVKAKCLSKTIYLSFFFCPQTHIKDIQLLFFGG